MNSPLIWCENQIKPIEELLIPATDRIFEHGLGLFETFRTWQGHHSTLNLNLERLRESTRFWQMFVSEPSLPTADNLHALKAANGLVGDAVFRLTATGGSRSQSVVWVQAKPLPAEFPHKGLTLILSNQTVTYHTPTTVYKSINYLNRRLAHDEAISLGAHEALLTSSTGEVLEGSRSNLFAFSEGILRTPPTTAPLLRGVMREIVLRVAESLGVACDLTAIPLGQLELMDEIFLTNAVRGVMPVSHFQSYHRGAIGPGTARISAALLNLLNSGGNTSWVW